jgi:hypothetical protein
MGSVARLSLIGLLAAAQGFAGMPYGYGGFRGYRGGYGYRFGAPAYGRARWYGGPRWGWGPGFFVPVLPLGCLAFTFGGAYWYYGGGYWYQPSGSGFVVAVPPAGIVVQTLPPDCTTSQVAGVTYYCANNVYYTALPSGPGYVVATPPPGAVPPPVQPSQPAQAARPAPPAQPAPGSPDAMALDALAIFPEKGQDYAQTRADRLDAQRYAMDKSGYDPARSDPADPGTPRARQAYLNDLKAYLTAHGYSVQ